jgi:hypothetical protein
MPLLPPELHAIPRYACKVALLPLLLYDTMSRHRSDHFKVTGTGSDGEDGFLLEYHGQILLR